MQEIKNGIDRTHLKYVSVSAKWIKTSRMHMLNIYTGNRAYENVFKGGAD